jgi:hypothetical protein
VIWTAFKLLLRSSLNDGLCLFEAEAVWHHAYTFPPILKKASRIHFFGNSRFYMLMIDQLGTD